MLQVKELIADVFDLLLLFSTENCLDRHVKTNGDKIAIIYKTDDFETQKIT